MALLVALGCTDLARGAEDEASRIVRAMDELYRTRGSIVKVEMTIEAPNWTRRLGMDVWTSGTRKTFIRITAPKKDAGIATLRDGNQMWNFFPNIDKVMKVPPSMMMGSWMGSDFSNDDLVRETSLRTDYDARLLSPPTPDVHMVELTPKTDAVSLWSRIVLTVRREDLLPLSESFYDEKGVEMRRMTFGDIRRLGGRTVPSVMELVPLGKKGHRTTLRFVEARFDEDVDNSIFTLRNLRRS
jgi:outer membrane lipoprotein-sorting protein